MPSSKKLQNICEISENEYQKKTVSILTITTEVVVMLCKHRKHIAAQLCAKLISKIHKKFIKNLFYAKSYSTICAENKILEAQTFEKNLTEM